MSLGKFSKLAPILGKRLVGVVRTEVRPGFWRLYLVTEDGTAIEIYNGDGFRMAYAEKNTLKGILRRLRTRAVVLEYRTSPAPPQDHETSEFSSYVDKGISVLPGVRKYTTEPGSHSMEEEPEVTEADPTSDEQEMTGNTHENPPPATPEKKESPPRLRTLFSSGLLLLGTSVAALLISLMASYCYLRLTYE